MQTLRYERPGLDLPDAVVQAGIKQLFAERNYNRAFAAWWSELKPCSKARFWQLMPVLVNEIESFLFKLKRSDGVKGACEEFFRKTVTGESERFTLDATPDKPLPYTWNDALGFVIYYEKLKDRLYKPLFELVTGRGDDGYGDLLDSLPLAGASIVQHCLDKDYEEEYDFEADLHTLGDKWFKLIAEGENYVRMHLRDAAKQYFLCLAGDCMTEQQDSEYRSCR